MSGLQEFLAPFSHLLFANRNIVIVLVCAAAFWAAIQALKDRWRADRLERDLNNARSSVSSAPAGRRYANAPEEAPESGGALPPVKGGRSYARNLGSALQKAGMSGPQIYSPPTPAGFAPNTNPMQAPLGPPAGAGPYAAPAGPWAPPGSQPTPPWAFPAAGGRNAPAPAPVPFYQPQPPASMPPVAAPTPNVPPPVFGPPTPPPFAPQPPGPFVAPPISTGAAPAPAPSFTPPPPAGPMMAPPVAPMAPPSPDAEGSDGGRRGKPKRRRFNFNVLENLEKMVQQKPAEAAQSPATSVPPAAAAPPAAPPSTPSVVAPSAPTTPDAAPAETPTLPFLFGQRGESKPSPAPVVQEPAAAAPPAPKAEQPKPGSAFQTYEPPAESEPPAASSEETTAAAEESEPQETHRSMRSMMFGEEIAPASAAQSHEAEPETSESESSEAKAEDSAGATAQPSESEATEPTWSSEPWLRREEEGASGEEAATSIEETPAAEDASSEDQSTPPFTESEPPLKPFGSYDPWKPLDSTESEAATTESEAWKSEAETAPEPVAEMSPAEADSTEAAAPAPSEEPAVVASSEEEATDESAGGSSNAPQPAVSGGDKGTLVIIEDDQTAASYYATLFKGNGYQVEVANDGVSGVDLCTRVQPQVILLDVMMPRQNGILVLQTLRASDETKNTPVVVMSNFSEPTLIKRAIQLGALEYVIKTQVEGPALLNALPRWMNREKAFAAA